MSVQLAGGDVWVPYTKEIATSANLADKSLITAAGAGVVSAANTAYGVIRGDVANGDYATVKTFPCIAEVLATGTVTEGNAVEALSASVYASISGSSTSTTSTGVQNYSSGYVIGRALSSSDANGTVLVSFFANTFVKPV